jgi:hypothetical protein
MRIADWLGVWLPAASVPAGCGTTGCLLTIGKGGASDRALLAPLTLAAQPGHEMPEHIIVQAGNASFPAAVSSASSETS